MAARSGPIPWGRPLLSPILPDEARDPGKAADRQDHKLDEGDALGHTYVGKREDGIW